MAQELHLISVCYVCPRRLAVIGSMRSGCTICWVTFGNGQKTAGIAATRERLQTAVHGLQEIVPGGWCGVVPGTTILRSCDPRTASGSPLQAGTTSAVSVLPGLIKS